MRDSNLSVFIIVEARYDMMSCTQAVYFSLGINTLRERVLMSQPRYVVCLASRPSPASLWSERGSLCFSVYEDCSGLNIVCMTNKAAFLHDPPSLGHQF